MLPPPRPDVCHVSALMIGWHISFAFPGMAPPSCGSAPRNETTMRLFSSPTIVVQIHTASSSNWLGLFASGPEKSAWHSQHSQAHDFVLPG